MAVRYRVALSFNNFADIEFSADFANDKGLSARIWTNRMSSELNAVRDVKKDTIDRNKLVGVQIA